MMNMNAIACKQAKDIFDRMLMTDMPGQNWNCVLIDDMGNGRNLHRVTPGIETRCVCFKNAGEKNLIMRTSKDYPLKFGMLIYIGKQEKFYLLKDDLGYQTYLDKKYQINPIITPMMTACSSKKAYTQM